MRQRGGFLLGLTTSDGSKNSKGELNNATVTVYEKNIQAQQGIGHIAVGVTATDQNVVNAKSYSLQENIGAVATHEATHATEAASYPYPNRSPQSVKDDHEKQPWSNMREYYKEIGDRP